MKACDKIMNFNRKYSVHCLLEIILSNLQPFKGLNIIKTKHTSSQTKYAFNVDNTIINNMNKRFPQFIFLFLMFACSNCC